MADERQVLRLPFFHLPFTSRLETEQTAEAELAQGSASGGDLRPDFREAEGESRPCYFPKASSLVHGKSQRKHVLPPGGILKKIGYRKIFDAARGNMLHINR